MDIIGMHLISYATVIVMLTACEMAEWYSRHKNVEHNSRTYLFAFFI